MDSVHYFVRGLFRGMSVTEKIAEQREELETHIRDRISDSMARGVPEAEAFSEAVSSLGNLDELIETMTGAKKKIYAKKADFFMLAFAAAYGTVYMFAVGVWFYFESFGRLAVFVAVPGWLGFVVPAVLKGIDWRRHRHETSLVSLDMGDEVRNAFVGWLCISAACWVANLLLVPSDTFLHEIWAWMPTFGVLCWPLMSAHYAWMVRNLKSLEPETA
jgi:hypothetical protein